MKTNQVLFRVYTASLLPVAGILFFTCLMLGYDSRLIGMQILVSAFISCPAVISLHFICNLMRRVALSKAAAWMLLFAFIPLLSILPSLLLVHIVPGNLAVLIALSLLAGYAGVLSQVMEINNLFNRLLYNTH